MRTDVDALDSTGALHEHCKGVCMESGMALPRDTKSDMYPCSVCCRRVAEQTAVVVTWCFTPSQHCGYVRVKSRPRAIVPQVS